MKKYLLAAAGALTLGLGSNANAALYINISGAAGTFGNTNVTCSTIVKPCAFSNGFFFSKPSGFNLVGATITSNLTGANTRTNPTNIDFTSVLLNGMAFNVITTGIGEYRVLFNQPLLNGTNSVSVSGLSGGNASYSGTLSFAAVPEPSTWLMMILGVGLTGFALRRRRQNVTVRYA